MKYYNKDSAGASWKFRLALCLFLPFLASCASYQSKVSEARNMLRKGDFDVASKKLEPLAKAESKDQLVYLLDYGTILQLKGDYRGSTQIFLQADKMADIKDYHSVSKITGSLLFNEGMVQYKGDDYEKVLINAMLAYNFLMEGSLEEALIETRRINEKLVYYVNEHKKKYEQNVYALYISAMIWEANRDWDDAYIAYEHAYKLAPDIPYLKEDLIRAAARARRWDAQKKWISKFGIKPKPEWKNKKMGELVLVYQQGWGPRKYPRPGSPRFPKLFPVRSSTTQAKLIVESGPEEMTQQIYSVESVAIKTLDDNYAALVAKRMAGIVAKEVAADQIRQQNKTAGNIAALVMHLSDQADLRQWSTLPQTFHVARVRLPAGTYKVKVSGYNQNGYETGEGKEFTEIVVKPRKKTFIGWRSYQ